MHFTTHLVTSSDGVQHELTLSEPVEGSTRPLIFCLPAMGVPARKYRLLAETIVKQGLACAIFELRGIESSSVRASRRENFGYHEMLNLDLPAAIELVRRYYPNNPIYLLGHSLGGQLGLLFMTDNPQQIKGLIGVATGLPYFKVWPFPQNVGLWTASKLMRVIATTVGHYPGRKLGFAGREARQVVSDWAYSVTTGNYRVDGAAKIIEARAAQRAIILTIDQDILAPQHSARRLGEKLPESQVEYQHLIDSDFEGQSLGHFNWMKEPGPVVSRIVSWLGE